jgi:CRP/FNR family transcriptional regulator, cyclic AMP receptor protein
MEALSPMAVLRETLARFALFRSLGEEEVAKLDRLCLWRRYAARSEILAQDEPGTDVYFVLGGAVRVSIPSLRRTDVILSDINAGEFFGELAAIDGRPRSASIAALTDATLARMPASAFREAIHRYPDVCDQILQLLASRVRVLDQRVSEFSTLGVRDRIRAELLRLGRVRAGAPNQVVISPPPIHAELAARVSTHREAVTRELKALERAGLLERRRGALVISDVESLTGSMQEPGADL